jgi:hypothetical protein
VTSSGYRHATDRVDGTIVAECPNKEFPDDDHLTVVVDYEDAAGNDFLDEFRDAWSHCGECGAKLDVLQQETPAEVLS